MRPHEHGKCPTHCIVVKRLKDLPRIAACKGIRNSALLQTVDICLPHRRVPRTEIAPCLPCLCHHNIGRQETVHRTRQTSNGNPCVPPQRAPHPPHRPLKVRVQVHSAQRQRALSAAESRDNSSRHRQPSARCCARVPSFAPHVQGAMGSPPRLTAQIPAAPSTNTAIAA